jgi:hypothetical protein
VAKNQIANTSLENKNTENKSIPKTNDSSSKEDYTLYTNSIDESKKELLLSQYQQALEKVDSIAKLLNNATEQNEIGNLTSSQQNLIEIASSKKLAADVIAYNIYNKEYEANKNALNQKLQSIPESDKENFKNSLSQIENDYNKAVVNKETALQQTNLQDKESNLNAVINTQNVVLVRQRKLLEQANSSIANNNVENKATANFKGFNNDRNSTATEAVNNLRPDYSNYKSAVNLTEDEVATIKRSPEYLQFEGIIDQARKYEESADNKAKAYTSTKAQGEEKIIESQQLIDLAAEEKKKSKKQALAEEAIRVDNEGKDLLLKADTIKLQAQNEMLKSAAIKEEADKMISKLDKTQQEKIFAAYLNQVTTPPAENNVKQLEANSNKLISEKNENKENIDSKVDRNIENQTASNLENKDSNKSTEKNSTAVIDKQDSSKPAVNTVSTTKSKETVLNEIKASPEYNAYAAIKDEAQALKVSAATQRGEADSMKVQAQRDAINSNDLFEFAAAQAKKKDRKEAQAKAEEMDRISKENEAKADSLNTLAEKAETAARMKQYEADNYLRKFDELKSKSLLMAYNNTVPEELLKANEPVKTQGESKTEVATSANSKVTDSKNNTSSNKTQTNQTKNNQQEATIVSNKNANNQAQNNNKNQTNKQESKQIKENNTASKTSVEQNKKIDVVEENSAIINEAIAIEVPKKAPKPDVKTTTEYNNFVSLKQEAEKAEEFAKVWKLRVDSTRTLSSQKLEESNNKLEEAAALKKRKRKPLVKEAAALDYESQLLTKAADSLNVFANDANKNARDKKAAADSYLASIDKELSLRIMRSIEGLPEPEEVEVVSTKENNGTNIAAIDGSNTQGQKSTVVAVGIQKGKPHGSTNPIKMNETLPDGLVFKVQIGAFNKPVADNAFGTISPVAGETIANSNLIRYTAGLFTAFEEASKARKELNALSYKDAFVVAYCYGKRISVTQAREMLATGKDCKTGVQQVATQNTITKSSNNNSTQENKSINENNLSKINDANANPPAQIKSGEVLPQQDIQVIKGLLYTVQVGVYSKQVKAGQLYNITPLYYELNQKGQYRYTSGIFNDVKEASRAKDVIVKIGVTDAFVSAYINGKRIPMEQAAAMEAQQGKSIFAQSPSMNVQPKSIPLTGSVEQRNKQPEPKEVVPTIPANNLSVNIVYKVQLGAFRNEVPVEIMNKYLTIADKGIANFKSGDLTIYTVGNYKDAVAAETVKAEVIAKGITDAFVIALNNGEKISLEDAKKLSGK